MNCKPGDRALHWRNSTPNKCFSSAIGTILVCQAGGDLDIVASSGLVVWSGHVWETAPLRIRCKDCGHLLPVLPDCDLKPLPPEDEVRRGDLWQAMKDAVRDDTIRIPTAKELLR